MRTMITQVLALSLMCFFTTACANPIQTKISRKTGSTQVEYDLRSTPQELEASHLLKITIRQGAHNHMVVKGHADAIERFVMKEKGGTLILKGEKQKFGKREQDENSKKRVLTIDLTVTDLDRLKDLDISGLTSVTIADAWSPAHKASIEISGLSEFTTKQQVVASRIEIDASGMSEVKMELSTEQAYIDVSGMSEVILTGNADLLNSDVSGMSKVDLKKFVCSYGSIDISGMSDAFLHVTEELTAEVSGMSECRNYGKANNVRPQVSGGSTFSNKR